MGLFGPKIKLPRDLYDKAAKRAEEAGFGSVDEYVAWLIERDAEGGGGDDDEETRKRLEGLGYIS